MSIETRTIKEFSNETGTICLGSGIPAQVRFSLSVTQDFVDGIPILRSGFGKVQFKDPQRVSELFISGVNANMKRQNVETDILLKAADRFVTWGPFDTTALRPIGEPSVLLPKIATWALVYRHSVRIFQHARKPLLKSVLQIIWIDAFVAARINHTHELPVIRRWLIHRLVGNIEKLQMCLAVGGQPRWNKWPWVIVARI